VIAGDLKNLEGTVINSNIDEVTIIPDNPDINEQITIKPNDLVNYYIFLMSKSSIYAKGKKF